MVRISNAPGCMEVQRAPLPRTNISLQGVSVGSSMLGQLVVSGGNCMPNNWWLTPLQDMQHLGEKLAPGVEQCRQLACKHTFHDQVQA